MLASFKLSTSALILISGVTLVLGHHDGTSHDHEDDHHHIEASKPVHLEVGEYCDLASAPGDQEQGTSWHVVEKDVEKICPPGTSCRGGACNCDDVDGVIMGISQDSNGNRVCRRIAGQKCSEDEQCFQKVKCLSGVCTCPQDVHCQAKKNDVYILD